MPNLIAYLTVYSAHSGELLRIPKPIRFHTAQDFKAHLVEKFAGNATDLFLLTSFGLRLDFAMINEVTDVYLFDKRVFAEAVEVSTAETGPEPRVSDKRDADRALLARKRDIDERCAEAKKRINAMFKCLNVMFQFVTTFISSTEKGFLAYLDYVKMLSAKLLHRSWTAHYAELKRLPTFTVKGKNVSLCDFVSHRMLQESAEHVGTHLPPVVERFAELTNTVNKIKDDRGAVDARIEKLHKESISRFRDAMQTSEQTLAAVTRLYNLLKSLEEFRAKLEAESGSLYQQMALLQMRIVDVKSDLKTMAPDTQTVAGVKSAEDTLSLTVDLPLLYGFVMIEARRQFEWSDAFSKGVVGSVSEQLSIVIDHEKSFQRLWLKKFGDLLERLGSRIHVHVPSLDVTLLNGQKPNAVELLVPAGLEREDISSYIAHIGRSHLPEKTKFVALLETNFKDLVSSTDNMKQVTRLVNTLGSFTLPANTGKLKIIEHVNGKAVEDDDFELVLGLRTRIKKLEDLLHQQQFKNLSNWPVVRNEDPRNSVLLQSRNPTLLLDKRGLERKVLDASTTIDKHLDNIRLKKENSELSERIKAVEEQEKGLESIKKRLKDAELAAEEARKRERDWERKASDAEIKANEAEKRAREAERHLSVAEQKLKEQTKRLVQTEETLKEAEQTISVKNESLGETSRRLDEVRRDLEEKIAVAYSTLENLGTQHEEELFEKKQEVSRLTSVTQNLQDTINNLEQRLKEKDTSHEVEELRHMQSELLGNMRAKEADFVNERNILETEIKDLIAKVDTKSEEYEELMEVTRSQGLRTEKVLSVSGVLVENVKQLTALVYGYFEEMCYILESMGLLLVFEDSEVRIKRVKGLRLKTETETLHSTVAADVKQAARFVDDFHEIPEDDQKAQTEWLVDACDKVALQLPLFISKVTFSDDRFFLQGVSRRFKDVEGFAKRLTKENKVRAMEVARSVRGSTNKVSVSNFDIGDLVLFLPTRAEGEGDTDGERPWTAFNIDAPHYFLDPEQARQITGQEWVVSRIKGISEHTVTADTAGSDNPFGLSLGVVWRVVQTV